jgi:DNA-binding transcriptional LysR family regulator
LKSPQDLSGQVLLHYDDPERRYPWLSWDVWFELTQTHGVKPAGTLRFSHYDQLIRAAIEGQGIALGRSWFVASWVKTGKLILPFGKRYMRSPSDSRAYFIVLPRGSLARPEVAEFSRWLQQQAQTQEAGTAPGDPVREGRGAHVRR